MSHPFHRLLLILVWVACGLARAASPDALGLLVQPGHVLLMRHANAPGVGDPAGMVLGDCSTQRNLDDRGRAQAKRLGERLRAAGLTAVPIYTSQWCRCRDTARLLDLGPVEDLPALNSFFEQPETKAARVKALRDFLDRLPRDDGPVVFVTHQVTVTALTGYFPASGEGLVLKLLPGGGLGRVPSLGRLQASGVHRSRSDLVRSFLPV
jgi:phosphohistidine phosphatase SixA